MRSGKTRNKKEHPLRNSNKVEHRLSGNDMLLVQAVIDDLFVKMFEVVCPK